MPLYATRFRPSWRPRLGLALAVIVGLFAADPALATPDQPPASVASAAVETRPEEVEPLFVQRLWRAGGGLVAPIAMGPDGAIYASTREGNLDVLEASGSLRFSVSLGGIAGGPIYVDARGSAYVATTTGLLVAISAKGQKLFAYRPPIDLRGGISYGPSVGLLFAGLDNIVLGVNRGGSPVFRFDSTASITLGPLALDGFCVVVTKGGVVRWLGQNGTQVTRTLPGAVSQVEAAPKGSLWVRSGEKLVVWGKKRSVEFELDNVQAMATTLALTEGTSGVVIQKDGTLLWLDAVGTRISERKLPLAMTAGIGALTLTGAHVWTTQADGTVNAITAKGPVATVHLPGEPLLPAVAPTGRSAVIGTLDGSVYRVSRMHQSQ